MKPFHLLVIVASTFLSCNEINNSIEDRQIEMHASNLPGDELARIHCGRCHSFVSPRSLAKSSWEKDILPFMGYRMGIYDGTNQPSSLFVRDSLLIRAANIYPEHPTLAIEDWEKIVQFYLENAPDTIMPPQRINKVRMWLSHFKYKESKYSSNPPYTSMVKILDDNRGIVYSDLKPQRNTLTFLNSNLEKDKKIGISATVVQYHERSDSIYLTTIGNNIFPHDAADGTLELMYKNKDGQLSNSSSTLISDLQRPVSMVYGDLDNNGLEDIVVCEFGNHTGQLVLYLNDDTKGYTKHVLNSKPGAISAVVKDVNKDRLSDIIVLMAQGDEGIFLYKNNGDNTFIEKRLLSFSPLNGSQYMELADFNNDGHDDIIYVCGDNADKTPYLKEHHGIYIFLNDGKFNFEQTYFYQLNGAYKAVPRDFDLDGDLDIAAISFFPDYLSYPEESFIYLENKGNLEFKDYSFPESIKGRWMVMDAEDMDGDGDMDLALGSFVYFAPLGDTTELGKQWLTDGPSVIVLENTVIESSRNGVRENQDM